MRRSSHSRDAEVVPLITSLASTGTATGRPAIGSLTMTAAITQLLPYPASHARGAEPPQNQPAARTSFPRRRNSASSTATVTGCPAGTSSATTWAGGYPDCRAAPARPGGLPGYLPRPHRRHPRQPHLLVTFARLHGTELVADGLIAAGGLASLVAELKAHLADPATITSTACSARAAVTIGHLPAGPEPGKPGRSRPSSKRRPTVSRLARSRYATSDRALEPAGHVRNAPDRRLGIDEQRKRAARSLAQVALIWRSCRTGDRGGGTQIDLRRRLADVIELAGGHGQAKRLPERKEAPISRR